MPQHQLLGNPHRAMAGVSQGALASEIGNQRRRIRPHRPLEVVGRNIGHAPRGFSLAVGQASPSAAALRLGGSAPSAYRRSGFPRVYPRLACMA
jgi:hypothetical protein